MFLHRHTPVVACDEIFVNPERCGGHVPVAVGAPVRLVALFALNEEPAVGEGDGFSRHREDALEIKDTSARAPDNYHIAPSGTALGIEPPAGADEQRAIGEGRLHAVSAHDHGAEPESKYDEREQRERHDPFQRFAGRFSENAAQGAGSECVHKRAILPCAPCCNPAGVVFHLSHISMNAKATTKGHAVRCARVHFDGRVQGVGFRQTTCLVARGYQIVGYVKNLQDGSVELLAQGGQVEVLKFLDALRAQGIFRFVRQEKLNWLETTQEFDGFDIRYG